jgi:hypothetical protein
MQCINRTRKSSNCSKDAVKVMQLGLRVETEMTAGHSGVPKRNYDAEVFESTC